MKHIKPLNLNEASVTKMDAQDFLYDYLKMGTKQNLFHKYLKKNGYSDLEISDFITLVINELEKYK